MCPEKNAERVLTKTSTNMKHKITYALIAAAAMCAASSAVAQDKATLDLLVSKGIITKQEAENVSKKSVAITPKEKTTQAIKLSGRIQVQYEHIDTTEYSSSGETTLPSKNDFIMRRMFLGMDASLGAGWSALIVADFASSGSGYIDEAIISKKLDLDFTKGKADFGYKKINFAFEENTSAAKLFTVERSIATRYFVEENNGRRLGFGGRHTGAFWQGEFDSLKGLTYGASVTNSYNNSPTSLPTNADNSLMYAANVGYEQKLEEVSFKAAVNFAYTNGMNIAGTAGTMHSDVIGFNPYITLSALGFDIWADFLYVKADNAKNSYTQSASPMGANVGVEYKFDIGEFGKLAPAIRYSWLDTDGRGVKMSDGVRNANGNTTYDAAQSIYVGLNWYIIDNSVKFQLGYEWAQLNGNITNGAIAQHSDANAVRGQLQILF